MKTLEGFAAVLFDLDGVLTPTALVHMRAWSQLFTPFLAAEGAAPYTDADYFSYIDGKPRFEGVASLLASRGIDLPYGSPDDAPTTLSVCGLGNRKNEEIGRLLATEGVQPYPGSLALVQHLADSNVGMAVVSSSFNAPTVLRSAGLAHFFPIVVDGAVAAQRGLPGKPAPDTFVYAAERLGVAPSKAVVVEDAISGVKAGAAGSFGLVVGVDRGVGEAELRLAGADLVVRDLAELV